MEISLTGNAPLKLGDINGTPIPSLETGTGPEMVIGVTQNQNTPGVLSYARQTGQKIMQFSGKKDGEVGAGGYLYTDLSGVSAITIQDLRMSIALQHIFEADARNGTRYREFLSGTRVS